MTLTDICRDYRRKKGMEMPTLALAKIIYKENPLVFKNVEQIRLKLSAIEGKRLTQPQAKKDKEEFSHPERVKNPYKLPEPDSEDFKPYILPTAFNDFIFAADFHVPNHRVEPIEAMLNYANKNSIKKLLLGGDLLDNTPFTRWLHEPINLDDVPRWFDMAKGLLTELKQQFDEIIWIEGNHDFWYKRWLMEKAELLFKDRYFHLEERLQLNSIGVKFIDQRYLVKAGKLNIHHGHITLRGGGNYASPARMLYSKTKSSMLVGHVHVADTYTEPNIDDKIYTTFTSGCMCTLRPEYQPFGGKACHGFAHVKVKPNKDFSVMNYRIYKGEIL